MFSVEEIKLIAKEIVTATCSVLEDVKVVIVDKFGNYMAMDDTYVMMKGTSEWSPYIDEINRRKEVVIIDNPGENDLCRGCNNYGNCPQTLEISVPFNVGNIFVGYISIVTFSQHKKEVYLERSDQIVNYLNSMINLMSGAARERAERLKSQNMSKELQATINAVDYSIVDCDSKGIIRYINEAFIHTTGIDNSLVGKRLTDIVNSKVIESVIKKQIDLDEQEVPLILNGKLFRALMKVKMVRDASAKNIGQVFSFRKVDDVRKVIDDRTILDLDHSMSMIIGETPQMIKLKRNIENIASSTSTVLIKGETGTGKELVARAIHKISNRSTGPFVTINCAAIPENLLESELFGYEDGAFTGGRKGGKAGLFEIANEGTIFLDEIGDMPIHLQVKLLRVLQEKEIMRIGGTIPMDLDIRLISATHQDLEELMEAKLFRADLFYRLNIIPINIPALRNRINDLKEFVNYFIAEYNKKLNKNILGYSDEFFDSLKNYPWPGNVRELENTIEYAINIEQDPYLSLDSLLPKLKKHHLKKGEVVTLKEHLLDHEKQVVEETLMRYRNEQNSVEKAAQELGLSRASLYRRIKSYE